MVMQQKTHQAVQFEITEQTRESISNWIEYAELCMLIICSKVDSGHLLISQPDNTPGL